MHNDGPDPLFERETELATLAAAVRGAGEGRGRLVVVEGLAGIGKTRLLAAARDAAADAGYQHVLAARGTEFESHVAFGIVRQLLDPVIFAMPAEKREALFVGAARLARTVFGEGELQEDDDPDPYPKLHGLFWLVSTLAREAPVAIVVDDVQWADEPSPAVLSFLARRIEGLPILVATATRPVQDATTPLPAALLAEPGATILRPAPLSPASVDRLVRENAG